MTPLGQCGVQGRDWLARRWVGHAGTTQRGQGPMAGMRGRGGRVGTWNGI